MGSGLKLKPHQHTNTETNTKTKTTAGEQDQRLRPETGDQDQDQDQVFGCRIEAKILAISVGKQVVWGSIEWEGRVWYRVQTSGEFIECCQKWFYIFE